MSAEHHAAADPRVATFVEVLVADGLSRKTREIYVLHLVRCLRWADANEVDLRTASAVEVSTLAGTFPLSARRHLRSTLSRYWRGVGRDLPPLRAIRVPPKKRYSCRALSDGDAAAMVKLSRGWYPQGTAALLGFYLGLRATEIAAVRWDRLDEQMAFYTVTGKFDVTATLPVHPALAVELELRRRKMDDGAAAAEGDEWITAGPAVGFLAGRGVVASRKGLRARAERGGFPPGTAVRGRDGVWRFAPAALEVIGAAVNSPWLFPGHGGRDHVSPQTIWNWVGQVAAAAGVTERVWPHRLRHTAIALVNDTTGDLRAAQEFARHQRPETTAVYTRVTEQRLQRAVASLDYA